MIFVNKMDKLGADFFKSVESVHERLGANAAAVQCPIGAEQSGSGIDRPVFRK